MSLDPRRAAADAIASSPIDRNDETLARVLRVASAFEREGDLRRAFRSVAGRTLGRQPSRVGTVAAIAAALDAECDDHGRTPMADIAIRSLVEALLDRSNVRGVLARVFERSILATLGDAPLEHFKSVAAHSEFRAELALHVRRIAHKIKLDSPEAMLAAMETALR